LNGQHPDACDVLASCRPFVLRATALYIVAIVIHTCLIENSILAARPGMHMIVFNILIYYLIIIPVSFLPFRVLYLFSDFLFFVLYRLAGYRTKVVRQNLENSFPAKSKAEILVIENKFYQHLCDVIVETFKSFTISEKEILRRMVLENPDLPNGYFDQGRSVLLAGGHYNNWEWIATSMNQQIKHKTFALYTPLSNKFFEQKMQRTRSKFGLGMIPITMTTSYFEENKMEVTATIFGIDQSPRKPDRCHWMKFLNQDTAVLFGLERYAKTYNYPVLFADIAKIKRGFYGLRFSLITDQPEREPHGYIVEQATHRLEAQIIHRPEFWLWTHKRWKHNRPADVL